MTDGNLLPRELEIVGIVEDEDRAGSGRGSLTAEVSAAG
jgi:hypothetical protein